MQNKMSKESTRYPDIAKWHSYRLEERHAPWKVFLPVTSDSVVLAVGLKGRYLASLARSWKNVLVFQCEKKECEWAIEHGRCLGHDYRFEKIEKISSQTQEYSAIAVDSDLINECDPRVAFRLLVPGGSVLWVGERRNLPTVSGLVNQGYQKIRKYAFLPPRTGKILLPLFDNKSIHAGINLYSPGKWHNRIGLYIAKFVAYMGLGALISSEKIIVAQTPGLLKEDSYLLDWLGKRLERKLVNMTVYSGWTKLVIQFIDERNQVVGIGKLADIALGKDGIKREYELLEHFKEKNELREMVPSVLSAGEWGGFAVNVQTSVGPVRKKYLSRLTPKHQEFLLVLSRLNQCEKCLDQWPIWQTMWTWAHEHEFNSKKIAETVRVTLEICAERLGSKKLLFHRVHGDFTPWHAMIGKNGIYVVDWEESEEYGLPLRDALHFILAREIRLKNRILLFENPDDFSSLALEFDPEICFLKKPLHLLQENVVLAILFEYMSSMVQRSDP